MTNYELQRLAELVANNIIQQIKKDAELLDRIFPPRLLDSNEAATLLKIPVNTLYQFSRQIPHRKIGKRLLFFERDLVNWVKKENEENKKLF